MFKTEIGYIKNDDIKSSAEYFISKIPVYFYEVSASSTMKYHPRYACEPGGLYKHVKVAVRIGYELLNLDMYSKNFTDDEKDLIILALILHDVFKKGIEEEKYTRFDHPLIMSEYVLNNYKETKLTEEQANILAGAIASHMGQWNIDTYTDIVLPVPKTKLQKFVHQCDYLASRKFVNVEFENEEIA